MTTYTVTDASYDDVEQLIRQLPAMLSGRSPDSHGIAAGFRARVGFTLLGLIAENFDKLSHHEAGVDGTKWPPNSAKYLAYQKGPKSSRKGSGRVNRWKHKPGSGMLTQAQMKQWGRYFVEALTSLVERYDIGEAKQIAASIAWVKMKARGATTLLATFGDREDTILVDEGFLRRSLQVGSLNENGVDAEYTPNDKEQTYKSEPGKLVVGTMVPYAAKHHNGKRRLWPTELPSEWWRDILGQAIAGLARIGELFAR